MNKKLFSFKICSQYTKTNEGNFKQIVDDEKNNKNLAWYLAFIATIFQNLPEPRDEEGQSGEEGRYLEMANTPPLLPTWSSLLAQDVTGRHTKLLVLGVLVISSICIIQPL